jgi:hypothetical protein
MTISKKSNYNNTSSNLIAYNIPFYTTVNKELGCNDAFKIITKQGTASVAG